MVSFDVRKSAEQQPCETCGKWRTRHLVTIRTSYMRGEDDCYWCCHKCCKRYAEKGLARIEADLGDPFWTSAAGKDSWLANAIYADVKRHAPRAEAS